MSRGFDCCPECAFCETEVCDACDDGDQFEESDEGWDGISSSKKTPAVEAQ
jgi:hypothetical protein